MHKAEDEAGVEASEGIGTGGMVVIADLEIEEGQLQCLVLSVCWGGRGDFCKNTGHLEEDRLDSLLQTAEIPSLLLRKPMSSASAGGLGALSRDGIHPNQDGHRVAAEAIAPYVLPMLER